MYVPHRSSILSSRSARHPLPWVTWRYSLIFAVALLGILVTVLSRALTGSTDGVHFRVIDATGAPVANATIRIADHTLATDANGITESIAIAGIQPLTAEREGFEMLSAQVDADTCMRCELTLRPVQVAQAGAEGVTAIPTHASGQSAPPASPASPATVATTAIRPSGTGEIAGKVLGSSGTPIQGARVVSGNIWDITGKDGIYTLDRAKIDASKPLAVFASGYQDLSVAVPATGVALDVTLERFPVKGIYYNPNISSTEADVARLIDLIDTTELNAIVIDVKEEIVYYDTQVKLFQDSGVVNPILDIPALLQRLHDHNIYAIARHVVFKDGLVAEKNPELAVKDVNTGEIWRDMNDVAWVNPTNQTLWKANADLAVELANLGFDEIQFDYVRFPTDGDLSVMDFGVEYNQVNREAAIGGFLKLSHEMLIPTGAKLSADVFGFTMLVDDDLGIGQNFAELAHDIDYLSPMTYPSHYGESALGYAPPNDYPYELISDSMQIATPKLDGNALAIRPWLQDFDFPGMKPYGEKEVRAQIDAVEENGGSGWLLWDPDNEYTRAALDPE